MQKRFAIPGEKIESLVKYMGGCYASDRITVDGSKVGYMYREEPDFDVDSGWRFMASYETQEYVDDARNWAIYDVNTIANYDREIIPLLDSPVGSAFARSRPNGRLIPTDFDGS